MAGVTAHGASFTFKNIRATITGISVEMPTAEVADMTGTWDSAGQMVIVPTGAWSGGTITVDFININVDPQSYVRQVDQLAFTSSGYSVGRRVLLESASVDARAGELIRGSLRFRMTDYTGT